MSSTQFNFDQPVNDVCFLSSDFMTHSVIFGKVHQEQKKKEKE